MEYLHPYLIPVEKGSPLARTFLVCCLAARRAFLILLNNTMRASKFHESDTLPKNLSKLSKKELIKRLLTQKKELQAFNDDLYEALRLYKIQADYFRSIAALFLPDVNRANPVIKSRYLESVERDELIKIPSLKKLVSN